ncbi:MAG TPA: ISAs1 family transposase, partial [Thermosynechococcus sp. M55_K2018_012]|nr:ISAs1 family transposase [Thermosynechococcus sp. M55_K2018_012]
CVASFGNPLSFKEGRSQETVEGGHGRIEMRCYWLLGATEHLVNAPLGPHLRRVGVVESEPRCSGQAPTIERRSYLLSLEGRVERAVRGHWGIENQVHWVLGGG